MTARTAARPKAPVWTETHEPSGRLQEIFGPLYITGIVWFKLCNFCARWLPYRACSFLSWISTLISCVLLRAVRKGVTANLNVVLGPTGFFGRELRIYRTLRTFSLVCCDRYSMFHYSDRLAVEVDGKEHWHTAMAHEHGCIIVSGHIGNWEVAAQVPMTFRKRMNVVREQELDAQTQAYIGKLYGRQAGPDLKFHYAADDASLGPALLLALRRGELVGLSSDQPRTGQPYVEAEMFGQATPLPHGPAALARAAEAVILPVFGIRTGAMRYRLIVGTPIRVDKTADRLADVTSATQKVASHIESVVAAHPHSWFCWYPRWPGAAASDPGNYDPALKPGSEPASEAAV